MPTEHYDEIKEVLVAPENYWGSLIQSIENGYAPIITRSRDSDVLAISNFETILKIFRDKGFETNRHFQVDSASHWAVGWVEHIVVEVLHCGCEEEDDRNIIHLPFQREWVCVACNKMCTPSLIYLERRQIVKALSDYPVLDEADYSEREYNELMEWLSQEVEDADACAQWLFDEHSISRVEDVSHDWITQWKEMHENV